MYPPAAIIGYGTMQLTGPGVWGPPPDWREAVALLRLAYDLGVRLFDSAWYYGPGVTHRLIAEAFRPYPSDLVLVSKVGNSRGADRSWVPALAPSQLREACHRDLRLLQVERLPLVLLRWHPAPADGTSFEAAFSTMLELQEAGSIDRIGLSNVTRYELDQALESSPVAAVSNSFSINNERDVEVLRRCAALSIPYLPYYPLLSGDVVRRGAVQRIARSLGLSPAQVAIAWLRAQAAIIVPIPGTRNPSHLRENVEAQRITLPVESLEALSHGRRDVAG
jgi:pyridoxine 4-dehydrogenase